MELLTFSIQNLIYFKLCQIWQMELRGSFLIERIREIGGGVDNLRVFSSVLKRFRNFLFLIINFFWKLCQRSFRNITTIILVKLLNAAGKFCSRIVHGHATKFHIQSTQEWFFIILHPRIHLIDLNYEFVCELLNYSDFT